MQIKLTVADATKLTQGKDIPGYKFVANETINEMHQTVILADDGMHFALPMKGDYFLGEGFPKLDETDTTNLVEAIETHKQNEY